MSGYLVLILGIAFVAVMWIGAGAFFGLIAGLYCSVMGYFICKYNGKVRSIIISMRDEIRRLGGVV